MGLAQVFGPVRKGEVPTPGGSDSAGTEVAQEVVLIVEQDCLIAMEAEHGLSGAGFKVSGIAATGGGGSGLGKATAPERCHPGHPAWRGNATASMPPPISIANWV
jgi:hypothetical protein